ncbi:MAG: ABC transporter substrate-binding protein [Planctomycetota bacterium]
MREALLLLGPLLAIASADGPSRPPREEVVRVGLDCPPGGSGSGAGLDQWRAAELAADEINAAGGVLGRRLEIVWRDAPSAPEAAAASVAELIDGEGCRMIFGGASAPAAAAAGAVCQAREVPFFDTQAYSTDAAGIGGHRYAFRAGLDPWAGAKVLAQHLAERFAGQGHLYVVADSPWGLSTLAAFRRLTATEDPAIHKAILLPAPRATAEDLRTAVSVARAARPAVLVLVLLGPDLEQTLREARAQEVAWTSHQPPAATPYLPAISRFRSVGLLSDLLCPLRTTRRVVRPGLRRASPSVSP